MIGGDHTQTKSLWRRYRTWLFIGMALILLAIGTIAGYLVFDRAGNQVAERQKAKSVVERVAQLYDLPAEEPTVAQISDKEKLKDQQFFAKAKDGDYLLVYAQEKIALIYREKANKIINAGPINEPSAQK